MKTLCIKRERERERERKRERERVKKKKKKGIVAADHIIDFPIKKSIDSYR